MGVPEKTLITAGEILDCIPQRTPIVLVDTFYGIDERGCARSGLTVTADNLFVADGVLDECGIVEHIAQSAALRAGYMSRTMGQRVLLGYIGAVLLTRDRRLSATGVSVAGGGISNDANHISAPSRTGDGLWYAIRAALAEAGIGAGEIGLVNTHGTATVYNDEMESRALHLAGLSGEP